MYLFFDTETNGLPKNYNGSIQDVNNWPRIIQLSWVLCDVDGNEIDFRNDFITPDNWEIPKEEFWIKNNFTTERNNEIGIPIFCALEYLEDAISKSSIFIAHNMDFDLKIIQSELIRLKRNYAFKHVPICTMKKTTDILQLPGPFGFKWPKLEELYFYLFREKMIGAHDSLNDVRATVKCFFELKKRQLI